MFKPVPEPRRGAPEQHPVDLLRTQVWMGVLKHRSGLNSGYALELKFDPDLVSKREAGVVRPRKWDAYEKGTKVPKPVKGKRYAVDQAEDHFHGTKRYFTSKMWDVLKGVPMTARDVDAALRELDPLVVEILLEPSPREGENERRFRSFDKSVAIELATLGTFDALAAAILFVAKSEAIGSADLRALALNCYLTLQPALEQLPELKASSAKLFRKIDVTCKHWVFPHPNARMEIIIFSDRMRKDREAAVEALKNQFGQAAAPKPEGEAEDG